MPIQRQFFVKICEIIYNLSGKSFNLTIKISTLISIIEFIEILHKLKSNLHISMEAGLIKFSQVGVKSPFFIEDYLGHAFVHPYTISTVACSIFIFLKKLNSFKDCIFELATAGGDSDTVGAIGGALAGAYFGLKNIPNDLMKLVKNYKKILKISEELYKRFELRY